MKVNELRPPKNSKRLSKRRGLGIGSGLGKTAGRGHKGSGQRAGFSKRPGFEGGQMPLIRRIPKRGFTALNKIEYQIVNVGALSKLPSGADVISPKVLVENGILKKENKPFKVLGKGDLSQKLIVQADGFSKSAIEKIEAKGGKAELLKRKC